MNFGTLYVVAVSSVDGSERSVPLIPRKSKAILLETEHGRDNLAFDDVQSSGL